MGEAAATLRGAVLRRKVALKRSSTEVEEPKQAPKYGRGTGVPNPIDVHVGGRVRFPADELDEPGMAEGRGKVEWLPALLGLGETPSRMGSRLIRAAVKPEGDSALRVGPDHGIDAVRAGPKVDGVILDTLQDLREDPHCHPEVSAP